MNLITNCSLMILPLWQFGNNTAIAKGYKIHLVSDVYKNMIIVREDRDKRKLLTDIAF
jgi:hypothetical protein